MEEKKFKELLEANEKRFIKIIERDYPLTKDYTVENVEKLERIMQGELLGIEGYA